MANAKISEWSQTAGSNTEIDGVALGEGVMTPSQVNNAIRELMSQVAELYAGASGDRLPVTAGGTGSTSAAGARANLGITSTATATEVLAGVAEIATAAETTTGTDDQRIVTPLKLTTFAPASATFDTAADEFIARDASDSLLKRMVLPAGFTIDSTATSYSTSADLSTLIPYDDTIPSATEGTQIMSLTITPKASANKIRATVMGFGAGNASVVTMSLALFRGANTDALRASGQRATQTDAANPLFLRYEDSPATAGPITYAVRVGPDAGVMRLNGTSSARRYGGVSAMTLTLEEIKG